MAGSTAKAAATAATYAFAGSGIVVLVAALIVGMLILSLIPIYSSNNSQSGFGEIYNISGLIIKVVYTNISANFTGGAVINLADLSNICTMIFRARNIQGFYGCVATSFTAYGPTWNTDGNSILQRRSLNDVALYEIGDMQLLFSSTCANRRALGSWYSTITRQQNSSCYAQRATACRTFITTPNTARSSNQWSPIPSGYTQLVLTNVTSCAAITISSIYNVAYGYYATIYGRYNISRNAANGGDCEYSAIVPLSSLHSFARTQTGVNATTCTSVIG